MSRSDCAKSFAASSLAAELALGLAQDKIQKQLKTDGQSEAIDRAISHLGDLR